MHSINGGDKLSFVILLFFLIPIVIIILGWGLGRGMKFMKLQFISCH